MNTSSNSTNLHEFWIEFIELYKSKPVLWKYGSEVYKDRKGKKIAYLELVKKMREVVPNATVDTVKRKINSMRSCYRRKWYKAQENIKLGMDPDIKWIYYEHFKFLRECKDTVEEEEDSWSQCEDSNFARLDDLESETQDDNDSIVEYDPQRSSSKSVYCSSNPTKSINELKDVLYTGLNSIEEADTNGMALKITDQHKFWIEFINLYRSKPELWKHGSEVYKDRHAKKVAYWELVQKMCEVEPNADVDLVKRKINSLRSIYRKKLHKKKRAISLGKSPEIKWVYFDHFAFLDECKDPLDSDGSWNHCENTRNVNDNYSSASTKENDIDECEAIEEYSLLNDVKKAEYDSDSHSPSPKKVRSEPTELSYKKLKDSNDEADILGISWAYQYRSLSETQKLFAKKAIDDILFEARLETLNRNSVKINKPRCDICNN